MRGKGIVAWLAHAFESDDTSHLVFGGAAGLFAFFMLLRAYSFLAACVGGAIVFVVVAGGLWLLTSSPRLGSSILTVMIVAVSILGFLLLHFAAR